MYLASSAIRADESPEMRRISTSGSIFRLTSSIRFLVSLTSESWSSDKSLPSAAVKMPSTNCCRSSISAMYRAIIWSVAPMVGCLLHRLREQGYGFPLLERLPVYIGPALRFGL
jgi:hypothetical protein